MFLGLKRLVYKSRTKCDPLKHAQHISARTHHALPLTFPCTRNTPPSICPSSRPVHSRIILKKELEHMHNNFSRMILQFRRKRLHTAKAPNPLVSKKMIPPLYFKPLKLKNTTNFLSGIWIEIFEENGYTQFPKAKAPNPVVSKKTTPPICFEPWN